jgi:beta-lactamase regulating signal transducer with metallopeptidase domain
MADRRAVGGFALGLGVSCALGFVAAHHVAAVGVGLTALVAAGGVLLLVAVLRHRALVRGLHDLTDPGELDGTHVRLGDLGDAAFVAGLRRPTIFCDRHLPARLTGRQLRAVMLHERAHQRSRDPARMLALGVVAPAVRRLPGGRQWLAAALARREVAADRAAIAHGAARADLAGALLALPSLARAHVAGFTKAADLRLQVLLGDIAEVPAARPMRWLGVGAAGFVTGAVVCSWALHHLLAMQVGAACC